MCQASTGPASLHVYSLPSVQPVLSSAFHDVAADPFSGLPIYALSGSRLLAYTSTSLKMNGDGSGIVSFAQGWQNLPMSAVNTPSPSRRPTSLSEFGTRSTSPSYKAPVFLEANSHGSQARAIGETARRLGEGLMSGVKTLSDFGYNRYMASTNDIESETKGSKSSSSVRGVSRSAPQFSHIAISQGTDKYAGHTIMQPKAPLYSVNYQPAESDVHSSVVVLDLIASSRLVADRNGASTVRSRSSSCQSAPYKVVAHFRPSKQHLVTLLSFNAAGTHILTSSSEGHSFHVFELRPSSLVGCSPARFHSKTSAQGDIRVWHRYRLNRGLTVARAIQAIWSDDSRYVVVTTSRSTAHVYPINPAGGRPSIESHLRDGVGNKSALQPLSVTVDAILRLKAPRPLPETLVNSQVSSPTREGQENLASHVRNPEPPLILFLSPRDVPGSLNPSRAADPSPFSVNLLVFYPHLGNIVLSRLSLSASPSVAPPDAPLSSKITSQAMSGLTQMMRSGGSLPTTLEGDQILARETKLAYYPLGKADNLEEVKNNLTKLSAENAKMAHRWITK